MDIMETILKERKTQGVSWNELAKDLPISGNGLRIAFSRNSVDEFYLKAICERLGINFTQNEQEDNIFREPESRYIEKPKDGVPYYYLDFTASFLEVIDNRAKEMLANISTLYLDLLLLKETRQLNVGIP